MLKYILFILIFPFILSGSQCIDKEYLVNEIEVLKRGIKEQYVYSHDDFTTDLDGGFYYGQMSAFKDVIKIIEEACKKDVIHSDR